MCSDDLVVQAMVDLDVAGDGEGLMVVWLDRPSEQTPEKHPARTLAANLPRPVRR